MTPIHNKILSKPGENVHFFKLIKGIYRNPSPKMFNDEKMNVLTQEQSKDDQFSPLLFNIILKG